MKRLLSLLCLAALPATLQAQDERPKLDPAKREALRERAAEIRQQVEALREELRELRGGDREPSAKPPRRGGHGGRDLRRTEGRRPPRGERPPGGNPPPRGERPHRGAEPRERGRLERGPGRELPPRLAELREHFREAGPFERQLMLRRMNGLRRMHGLRHARGAGVQSPREMPRAPFRRR
jgi:hypothetical protein